MLMTSHEGRVQKTTTSRERSFVVLRRSSQRVPSSRQTLAERAIPAIAGWHQDSECDDLVQDLDKEFENELNALDNPFKY